MQPVYFALLQLQETGGNQVFVHRQISCFLIIAESIEWDRYNTRLDSISIPFCVRVSLNPCVAATTWKGFRMMSCLMASYVLIVFAASGNLLQQGSKQLVTNGGYTIYRVIQVENDGFFHTLYS